MTDTTDPLRVISSYDGRVITLELNRPEKRNAIDHGLAMAFRCEIERIRQDRVCRIVVIRGAGGHFCAGDDISEFRRFSDDETAHGAASFMMREVGLYQDTARALEDMEKIVVCAVDGNCIGGGLELTMVADLVIATDRANFGIPEIDIDITPGWGGTSRLSRYVGRHKVKEMVLLGTLVGAREALSLGLVNRVVASSRLEAEVDRIIRVLLEKRPMVLKLMKFITNKGLETSTEGALAFERLSAMLSWTTGEGAPPIPPATSEFVAKAGGWRRRREMVAGLGDWREVEEGHSK